MLNVCSIRFSQVADHSNVGNYEDVYFVLNFVLQLRRYQFCLANIVELMKGIPSPCYQLATNFSWGFSLVFDYCHASIV